MQSQIEFEDSYAMLRVELQRGEKIKAEPGSMVAMDGVKLTTSTPGGPLRGMRRMLGGESFAVNTFEAERDWGGRVYLAPALPGGVGRFDLEPGENLFIQSGSFLACSEYVKLDSKWQGFKSLFSGESMFFLRAGAEERWGTVFYNSYGAVEELIVPPGHELVVDTGHLVAFSEDVDYSIGKVGGIRSALFGGEGLVLKFRGNGHVWIQTRNLPSLAEKLVAFLPGKG